MPSECMAIGREPRSEKTEGFRACPASREAERIRLRRKRRKPGAENRRFSSVSGFERSGENSVSKEAEETRLRRKRREFGFERSKGSGGNFLVNNNWWKHLKTINHHKWLVMKNCFRLGMYKQGLLHDLSKYSPTEFLVGVKYYQGNRSPNNAEREDKGYTSAWLHHKGRNKHHLEYWLDYDLVNGGVTGMKMPVKYVVEMFCDRIAASKNYNKDTYTDRMPLEYFQKGKAKALLHPESAALLEKLLTMLAEQGEDKTFDYIKREILTKEVRREKI